MSFNQVSFECYACGFESDELSYFMFQNVDIPSNPETICMGCYENYRADCDTFIEDGE